MWNPFRKKTPPGSGGQSVSGSLSATSGSSTQGSAAGSMGQAPKNMGMLQRLAMKKLMSMSEQERQQLMQKFLSPENIGKNKDKILAQMEQMKNSGMITDSQYEEGKKRLGL